MAMRSLLLFLITALLLLGGCSTVGDRERSDDAHAAEMYQEAKRALDSGNYELALERYNALQARYPYGPYAQQAQLETAYAYYRYDQPAAAVSAAERFIRLHPRHQHVDYAYYLRGLASFSASRGLFASYFPQDPAERDPASAREAFNHFNELVTRFPHSRYTEDAVQRMVYLRDTLARHEVLAADYYVRRGAWLAAANRAQYTLEHYPETAASGDALVIMVKAYRAMNKPELADDALKMLRVNHPDKANQFEKTS